MNTRYWLPLFLTPALTVKASAQMAGSGSSTSLVELLPFILGALFVFVTLTALVDRLARNTIQSRALSIVSGMIVALVVMFAFGKFVVVPIVRGAM